MARESNFKMITDEEYSRMFITFKRDSNQDAIIRDGIMTQMLHKYGGKSIDMMSIGAGTGWLEDEIIRHPRMKVDSIVAIEPDPERAEILREKSANWKDTITTVDLSYFAENYEIAKQFDVILMIHSLYYTREPIRAIEKAKSFLKPGGQVMIAIRGSKGGIELASCLHEHVTIDPSICIFSWESSEYLTEKLKKNDIKYQIQDLTSFHDVTDFIERNNTPTCNDTVSFFLHTNYDELDKGLQGDLYNIVKDRITVTKDKKHMFNHVTSFIFVDST